MDIIVDATRPTPTDAHAPVTVAAVGVPKGVKRAFAAIAAEPCGLFVPDASPLARGALRLYKAGFATGEPEEAGVHYTFTDRVYVTYH